jgi:hypothetical protein
MSLEWQKPALQGANTSNDRDGLLSPRVAPPDLDPIYGVV